MKTTSYVKLVLAFMLLVTASFADEKVDELSSLLKELRAQSSSLETMPTRAQQKKLDDLNRKLISHGRGCADAKLRIRGELMSVMRVDKSAATETGVLLYASYLMRSLAKICTAAEFLEFSEDVILSDSYEAEMRVDLLRMLGYELRKSYDADDLKPLLSKAARLDDDNVRGTALKMLIGWTIGSIQVSPVSMDEGIKVLEELVEKSESFESKQPFLEKLARMGYGRRTYVEQLRQKIENTEMPVAQRHKYATDLLKWYAFLVQELEKEMGQPLSKTGDRVIKAGGRQ